MNIELIQSTKNINSKIYLLEKNDFIKLDDGDETFWAIIFKKLRNCVLAKIDSKLLFEKDYNYGDIIKCNNENIIDTFKI